MSQQDQFDRILASLHATALGHVDWPSTAALIDDACGATGNKLVFGEGFGDDVDIFTAWFCYRGQRREDLEREYFGDYHFRDERLARLRHLPDSQLVHITSLYTEKELRTSSAYNEAQRRSGGQNGLNVRLNGSDGSRIVWATADPVEPGGWGSAQIRMIERLLPRLRQFVCVRQALADAGALGGSLTALLDTTRSGVIQLDRRGRIVETNDHARALLRRGDGVLDRGGFLHARWAADNARLQRLLAAALPRLGGQATSGGMTIGRSSGVPHLVLHLNPVGDTQADFSPRRVAALVWIVDLDCRSHIHPRLVATALGLTPAESRVAVALAEGRSVRDLAAVTGRKEGSIRWHINQIHRKLGLTRQVDLVRLVLSITE